MISFHACKNIGRHCFERYFNELHRIRLKNLKKSSLYPIKSGFEGGAMAITKAKVDQIKKKIREELVPLESDKAQRLKHILKKIHLLAADTSEQRVMKKFIYIMSALVHHERWGGLTQTQINHQRRHAIEILKSLHISPDSTSLGYLYGEVWQISSQISRQNGDHWISTWEQNLARRLSQSPNLKARMLLADGIRAHRLGHGPLALDRIHKAQDLGLPDSLKFIAAINEIQILRLQGLSSTVIDKIGSIAEMNLDESQEKNLHWELMCTKAILSEDCTDIVNAVAVKESHYQPVYYLEAFLWNNATPFRCVKKIAKVSSMARNRSLAVHKHGFMYTVAKTLEEIKDLKVPLSFRIDAVGQLLSQKNQLMTIEKELLLLSAVTRWLIYSSAYDLAALTLNEYESICYKISGGKCRDPFGSVDKYYDKDWYLPPDYRKAG